MPKRALPPQRSICQLCDFARTQRSINRSQLRPQRAIYPTRAFSTTRRVRSQKSPDINPSSPLEPDAFREAFTGTIKNDRAGPRSGVTLESLLEDGRQSCKKILASETIPNDKDVLHVLEKLEMLALALNTEHPTPPRSKQNGAASALLSLDGTFPKKPHSTSAPALKPMSDEVSTLAYSLLQHPPVYITPEVLNVYVHLQAVCGKPETLPEILHLYANKSLPVEGTSPIRYKAQNPNKAANAVPLATADAALQAAINTKKLVTAMDIIQTSYCTTAALRAKFIRKALLPLTSVAFAPVAAYAVASKLSLLQNTMDPATATTGAFAGFLAYMGFTATMGYVALTTANDQMDRVTWAQGLPLRVRWMREDERAAVDKVAGAWGFKQTWRRGEEEGVEWELIREWVHQRAMMLDRVELMEGME